MAEGTASLEPAAFLREHIADRLRKRIEDLRAQVAPLERELEDRLAAEATLEFVLEGDGGGAWFVNVHGEDARVELAPARPPLIRLSQSRADWEVLARSGLGVGAPPGAGDLTRARIMRLASLKGTLEFRLITDDSERRVLVQFGPADPAGPRCSVALRADDARRLQSGDLTPQAAFLQGIARLEGDVALAMQVGAALFL